MLRKALKHRNLKDIEVDKKTCEKLKNKEVWPKLQLKQGPFNNFTEFCTAFLHESFNDDLQIFPCSSTCGYCSSAIIAYSDGKNSNHSLVIRV